MKNVAGDLGIHVKPFGELGVARGWGLSPCRLLAAGGTAADCVSVRRVIHNSDEHIVRKRPKCSSTRTSTVSGMRAEQTFCFADIPSILAVCQGQDSNRTVSVIRSYRTPKCLNTYP